MVFCAVLWGVIGCLFCLWRCMLWKPRPQPTPPPPAPEASSPLAWARVATLMFEMRRLTTTNADAEEEEANLCSICLTHALSTQLHPCMHRLCVHCAARVCVCPFCRAHILLRRQSL